MSLLARRHRTQQEDAYELIIDDSWKLNERRWDIRRPSRSLSRLLGQGSLTPFGKLSLSIRLVNAVWEFYTTPWMHEPWNKDRVHFVVETRSRGKGLFVDEPLLETSIPAPGERSSPRGVGIHRIPKISALGIMLLEIWLERPIESYCNNQNPNEHTRWHTSKQLVNGEIGSFEETEIPKPVKEFIAKCIVNWKAEFWGSSRESPEDYVRDRLGTYLLGLMPLLHDETELNPAQRVDSNPMDAPLPGYGSASSQQQLGASSPQSSMVSGTQNNGGSSMAYQ